MGFAEAGYRRGGELPRRWWTRGSTSPFPPAGRPWFEVATRLKFARIRWAGYCQPG
jgi:hypothetical protein